MPVEVGKKVGETQPHAVGNNLRRRTKGNKKERERESKYKSELVAVRER